MNQQTQPAVSLDLTMDEANTLINIVAQAPLPYNVSHPLIQKIGSQVAMQVQAQDAPSATPDAPANEVERDESEHTH